MLRLEDMRNQNTSAGSRDPGQRAPSTGVSGQPQTGRTPSPTRPARILVVEDQVDVRRMLVTALEIEGHQVDEAGSAAEGLRCLHQGGYDLVLSDYAMPGGTGTWMLHEASRLGLMNGTVALIVTAHPEVEAVTGVEVITKPLDLDFFLEQVRRVLAATSSSAPDPRESRSSKPSEGSASHRVDLVLYISSASAASTQARRNLERLLAEFHTEQVKYRVCDLVKDPRGGEADRIAFTPTLVKRHPEPRMWILGNLKEAQIVADLLRMCGVDARE